MNELENIFLWVIRLAIFGAVVIVSSVIGGFCYLLYHAYINLG